MPNLDPGGLLFNTVDTFVEQVGRRKQWKYGELDTLVCIWNGPASGAQQFKPQVNSPHPNYPLMFCTDSQITDQAALISEIQVTYQGIIQSGGASSYVTPPIISVSPVQGSRDFVTPWETSLGMRAVAIPVPGQELWAEWVLQEQFNFGTRTRTVRYVGTQCTITYQSYPKPSGLKYSHLGLSYVSWTVLSSVLGPMTTSGTGPIAAVNQFLTTIAPVPPLYAANLGVTQQQRGKWYQCTEIYGPTF